MVTVLEKSRVSPPPGTNAEKSLPLTFFDFLWLRFRPVGRVIFFDIPCSTNHFTQNIVPYLKTSLSHALEQFSPLAGNLIKPSNINSETEFQIRYVDGDSVSVTFAECIDDFIHISGNQVRDADILNPLVPQLPGVTAVNLSGEECSASPVLAIQVTIFPNYGVCFGFTHSHAAADGRGIFNFIMAWASLAKQVMTKADAADCNLQSPYYDRTSLKDPLGLTTMYKSYFGGTYMAERIEKDIPDQSAGDIKVRATFILKKANIEALKSLVIKKKPAVPYVSSLTAACAYIWTCLAKTRAAVVEGMEQEPLNFLIAYDCRARLDPPLPASYFGNCILASTSVERREILAGEEGLFTAAEVIGKGLYTKLNNKEGVLNNAQTFLTTEFAGVRRREWYVGVAGSPKLDYYNTIDFGWGRPRKFEFVSEPLSISRCKDSKVDLELGLIMPKNEVDVFSSIFAQGLAGVST
ncbi:putative transferase, Chloramphenicol acetyltransferase-like domain protein [Heracleum sosnowskyi]|uniref:Transferase, Chloramphenicol acetyltransferase-like domain protein n=1 Tax=Heracleum sosnowskyi TaxID=360622 RepID=A0AAD8IN39_9APIA|nr:putative transferase, Chloramphenicol acetyltransferase-like domain protein [Heracleum sosnowskyi]